MDPEALLEHAVFQLTPTRTRCDLVIFNGGISEKIASGLVGPFVSHLKYAKDQLPKGGYSIRLTPPTNVDASWFTKSTFQRFVRFVSTPEVLERFVGLEKEILQIESSSVQSKSNENEVEGTLSTVNGFSKHSSNGSKVKNETEGTDGAVAGQEENSKIRLQRLMETRKALLRKEQAMAYARALAAGFELENIDDLLYFADAFGASRLRDACTEFKDLCKKKHGDGLWMDELAAMQAAYAQLEQPYMVTPGIVLTSDGNNGLDQSTDSISSSENNNNGTAAPDQIPATTNTNVQMQMPWPNQIPPYMFNFQKQMQNMSPYQAYPFPGMPPPYYNMGWPPNMDEHQRTSSKKKKKKSPNREADEEEEEEELTESEEENESDTRRSHSNKKKQQKSSKTVVIKNINYITSDKRNGDEDESSDDEDDDSVEGETDEDSLKQVHDIIGSIQKHHQKSNSNKKKKRSGQKGSSRQEVENNGGSDKAIKEVKGNDNWENFQNLLMRDDDPPSDMVENHQSVVQNDFESGNSRSFDLASEKLNTKRNFGMDSFDVSDRNVVNEGRGMEDFANGENFRPIRLSGDDSMLLSQRVSGSGNITREGYIPESSTIKHGKAEDWFVANHSGTYETNGISTRNMFEGNFTSQTAANMEKDEKVVPIDDSFMVTTRTSVDDQFDSQWKTDISMVSGILNSSQTEVPNKLDTRNSLEPDELCAVFTRDSAIGESWSSEMDYGVEISFVEPNQKPSIVEPIVPVKEEAKENGNSPNPKKQTRTKTSPASKIKSDFLSRNKTLVAPRKPITPKSKLEKEEEARKKMEEQMIERQKRIAERTAASGAAKKLPLLGSKVSPSKPGQLKNTSTK